MAYRVLLVNDNQARADLGKSILTQKGFEVLSACSDDEVRIILHIESTVDLILLDSRMSIIYNWEILRMLRTSGIFAQIPVMILMEQHYLNVEYFYDECLAYIRTRRGPIISASSTPNSAPLFRRVMKDNIGFMFVPDPNADICQECLTRHASNTPHCKDSLYYQCTFHVKNGRWPTWIDATAHCASNIAVFSSP